ncbi:MAG: DNA translocase FtsK 4TM domain-containing protein, partial [Ignavibacteriae bacterium]|nr:DNA translocase FtsK 4TM domain-containing protein [Ignavibacteriota bacterium]
MTPQARVHNEVAHPGRRAAKHSSGRQTTVIAVLMMAAALLILLALISHDPADEANADIRIVDLIKVFTGDPIVKAKADTARNWLGLIGSIISDFLIKSTIGYSVFCLPFLMIVGGLSMLRKADFNKVLAIINYTLVGALLISTSFGMARLILGGDALGMEWSGVAGDFLSTILAQLLGRAGGAILLFTGLFITLVLAIDLDLRATAGRVRNGYLRLLDWLNRRRDAWRDSRKAKKEMEDLSNQGLASVRISKP